MSCQTQEEQKAVELETLGSDAGSVEDTQTTGEARRVAQEEQWVSKLKERVEKRSDVKFLEFCKKQRAAINGILVGALGIQGRTESDS